MDVKCGHGAFMKNHADAKALAQSLVANGNANGVKTEALITRMDAPLGVAIGNALVTFHNGPDGSFSFSNQAGEFCAGNCDLVGKSLKFGLAFIVRSRRAFAFARQTICLLREFLEAVFKLPSQLMQALRGGGVAQQLSAG